jgi:hypothetical protein
VRGDSDSTDTQYRSSLETEVFEPCKLVKAQRPITSFGSQTCEGMETYYLFWVSSSFGDSLRAVLL